MKFDSNPKPSNQVNTKQDTMANGQHNRVGLEKSSVEPLVQEWNLLLSDYQVYYQNLRGVHWNIKGEHFFTLHEKFEELYTTAADNIDMVAERVLTLGSTPYHSFKAYLEHSDLDAVENVTGARESVSLVLDNTTQIISRLRKVVDLAENASDEGSADMAIELMRELEKNTWMLEAFLR